MRNIWTLAKREYNNYFMSPIAYVVALLFLGVVGIIFVLNLVFMSSNQFGMPAPDTGIVTGPMAFLLIFATPALTMRLVADEIRMGTMELLLTGPVRDHELILGKWLGVFLYFLSLLAVTLIFPLILNSLVNPGIDLMKMFTGYLGIILLAAALMAIGVGISALFSNQIAAFFVTSVLLIVLWWLVGAPANVLPIGGEPFKYLDLSSHFYNDFNAGIITLGGLVYYISLTCLGLFLGTTAVEMRRWR